MTIIHQIISTALAFIITAGFALALDKTDSDALERKIAESPTLGDLVSYSYLNNPSIEAARQGWRAVAEKHREASSYPDPQLTATYFPRPIETRLGPQDWNAMLMQMIPFPGKLSKAGDMVEADAAIARFGLDKAVRDATAKVRESFHELIYIRQAARIAAQTRQLLDKLRETAETAHANDRAAFMDVAKAQSQLAQLQYDEILLEELAQTETAALNALLNREPQAKIGSLADEPLLPLVYSLQEIYGLAGQNEDEIKMAGESVRKAELGVDLARFQNYPSFSLGVFYAGIGEPESSAMQPDDAGRDAVGIQAGVSIPLWLGKNSGRVGSATAEAEKIRALKTAKVNETKAKVSGVYFRLGNAERLIRLYRDKLLPQAAESMELAETWFRDGEGSFSDFVETEAVWYNFQLALARSRADYGKFLARLEALSGASLTKRQNSGEESK